jgi:iron complex transport system permease protein
MHLKNTLLLLTLFLLALISLLISISFGSVHFSEATIWQALQHHGSNLQQEIINQLRLPRSFNAFIVGGLLALAGCLMQTLLRNPLADPYILGVSGGSAVATLLAILFAVTSAHLIGFTFLGGILVMLLVMGLNFRSNHWRSNHLLLTGVIIAAGCNAIITLVLSLSNNHVLRSMMFWLIGEIYTAPLSKLGLAVLIVGLLLSLFFSKALDLLNHGEAKAQTLGIHTLRLKILLYIISAILTATAVSIAGPIGFVGLIIPHILRLLGCYQHRYLLIGSVLLGGSFLCLADTLARSAIAPQQLPVGAITAIIGVPVFLILLKARHN